MTTFNLTIDGRGVEVSPGESILDAARKLGVEIPTLCYLEKCGPLNSCQVCLVKVKGKLVPSCGTKAEPGMAVESDTSEVRDARRTALELLFSDHVGDCLSPCHRLCPLRMNIPVMLRQVQAGKLDQAIITVREALPLPRVLGRLCHHPCEQGCRRASCDSPATIRDLERHVADQAIALNLPSPLPLKPPTGKSVVIVGAGPTGLAAAYHLLRQGHGCVITDRRSAPGGSLHAEVERGTLPVEVLENEIKQLENLGAKFMSGITLGMDVTLEGLLRGFDAVVIAIGETSRADGEGCELEMVGTGIKVHPETFQTENSAVFAAGRATRNINQLIRAVSDGVAAAECADQYLSGKKPQRHDKVFSSIMGRIAPEELAVMLQTTVEHPDETACAPGPAAGMKEPAAEASRCLHCDCVASGNCSLQTFAQKYEVDASRYRQQRRTFERYEQPGGVIWEPGKCIQCGICVKLTELAGEPLGLTFTGRGFNVRVRAPFTPSFADGLQKVARECVNHCPTGALTLSDRD